MATTTVLERGRRRFTAAFFGLTVLGVFWAFGPGLPVWWGPWASAAARQEGRELFLHEWQAGDPLARGDGLGPVFNARSCAACHFQGGAGGGGPNAVNVTAFEVLPTTADPALH